MQNDPQLRNVTDGPAEGYFIGVEVGAKIIRAGVYSESLRLVGKTKLSTKPERGPETVVARIARCVLYAADECDLPVAAVRGIGVAVPGTVDPVTRSTVWSSELAWTAVPLLDPLQTLLGCPTVVENNHNLSALGVCSQALTSTPGSCLAIFLGPQIGGALIANDQFQDLTESYLPGGDPVALARNVLGVLPHPQFDQFRSRDFRKALRKGNPDVRHYLLQVAHRGGEFAAHMVSRYAPDLVVFGGGVLDEMHDEMKNAALEAARLKLGCELGERTIVTTSALGDLAGISGAAAWAARSFSTVATAPSIALDAVH
jgi:glucokinase